MKTFVFSSFILFSLFLFGCVQKEYATKGDVESLKSSVDSLRADCTKKPAVKPRPKKFFVKKEEFSALEKRVETLEEKLSDLDEKNKSDHQDIARGWQDLDARVSQNSSDISDIKINVAVNSERVSSLEKRADLADKRIDEVENETKSIRESMWNLLGMKKPAKKKSISADCPPGWQE